MSYFKTGLMAFLLLCAAQVWSVVEVVEFSDESLRPRYQQLIEELRCPKCQNQNLADSNSPISVDMRREIKRMLEEGASDDDVKQHLTSRYSEFVLYRPQVKSSTLLLWGAPLLLLLIALVVVFLNLRRQPLAAEDPLADAGEDQRLAELLAVQAGSENERSGKDNN